MGDFGEAERRILGFMSEGTEFVFEGKEYAVVLSGKPTCRKGEPKTDIYILAESDEGDIEIKISYKKENADFIENNLLKNPDITYITVTHHLSSEREKYFDQIIKLA